ncbi:MAG: SH3 domain-containing protein [Treponema sp.]|nr:SH3 domain-containing protein [Treponema sp.]
MNFLKSLFSPAPQEAQPVKPPVTNDLVLVPNEKYCLTRQMYLFPAQEVSARASEYLKIGAVVSFLKEGGIVEDNNILSPWAYVRSAKGREGWCFSHYLKKAE